MKFEDFISKYKNKKVDFDGAYNAQCVDLFNQYLVDCMDITNPIQMFPVAAAYQIWDYAKGNSKFERIENTPEAIPQAGDIIIWNQGIGEWGHVAIFIKGDVMSFTSLDQNWNGVQKCEEVLHSYKFVTGWLRPVKEQTTIINKPEITKPCEKPKPVFDLSMLDGNKTKIVTALTIVIAILGQQGYIDQHLMETLNLISTALIGYTLRDAIKKK